MGCRHQVSRLEAQPRSHSPHALHIMLELQGLCINMSAFIGEGYKPAFMTCTREYAMYVAS